MQIISFITLILGLSFTSCLTLQKIPTQNVETNDNNSINLNGDYLEVINGKSFENLAEYLMLNYQYTNEFFNKEDTVIYSLNNYEVDKLEVIITQNGQIKSKDTLSGIMDKNYFILDKQKSKDQSEGIVLFYIEKNKSRLTISKDGFLVVDNGKRFILKLLFVPIVIEDEFSYENQYKRI